MKLKILSLLVALVALVCLFASCTPDNGGNGGEGSGNTGDYPWSSSKILIELYENDNHGELSSGLKRYYAGKDQSAHAEIDDLISARNTAATETTGVTAEYSYKNQFAWGESFNEIQTLVDSNSSSAPDVYCNYAYDLTSLALRNCFANLLSNKYDYLQSYGQGNNYFEFAKEGYVGTGDTYFDSEAGKGYFFDYMQSLSFANAEGEYDKMYCLASNYCVDLVRSFLVVPVNVKMMNEIALDDSTGDKDGDLDFDIEDFYHLVWEGGWTYGVLADYCNAVFVDNGTTSGVSDINDTLGAAFGRTSGLTSSGLLYTSSVKIITKTTDASGKVSYYYPATNSGLVDFAEALETLFRENAGKGICSVTKGEVTAAGLGDNSEQGELVGIRQQFANDKMLFGGIICVGSLEEQVYQDMIDNSQGFGIVPVPVYKEGDEYLTLVHNLARVVAISKSTTEFEQCTAFLNYQSTNSQDILDAYYEQELVAKVGGLAGDNNKKMLTYIRNHVRDCFDKTYEDVIASYMKSNGDSAADSKRWHTILQSNSFMYSGMSGSYGSYYTVKDGELKTVLNAWNALSVKK